MLRQVLRILILCILLTEPVTYGMNQQKRRLAHPHKEMAPKRTQNHRSRFIHNPMYNSGRGRFLKNHRRSKREYQDFYSVYSQDDDPSSYLGDGWGGELPASKPKAPKTNQVQDVYLQSVNAHQPQQQQSNYQNLLYGPAPAPPPNPGNFNGGQVQGYGQQGPQQQQQQHHHGGQQNSGYNQPPAQLPPLHQGGGGGGPIGPYQNQYNEPSNNGGYNGHRQESFSDHRGGKDSFSDNRGEKDSFFDNWGGKDSFSDNRGEKDSFSDNRGEKDSFSDKWGEKNTFSDYGSHKGSQDEEASKSEYYKDPRWSEHLPNQGERTDEQKHWLRGDPNAKAPLYKPTLPPRPPGKSYQDFIDEDARDLERVFENANERARKKPHSYAPVPHGKLMNHERRREQYNYNVPAYKRREDMEKSGELAYVPKDYYVKPLQYVDKNFKFMEPPPPPKSKWGKQSQQGGKKGVEDNPTPFIEWAKFGSDSTSLLPSRKNLHILSLLLLSLLICFIL